MFNFKPLELEDKEIFDKFLSPYPFYLCTYSFTNLFMWRNISDIQYTVCEDCLIIKKRDYNNNYHFIEPINLTAHKFNRIVDLLVEYSIENNLSYLFKDITKNFALKASEFARDKFTLIEDRDSFDYIYNTQSLLNLKGNRYKSQRNHYNYFIKNVQYDITEMDSFIAAEYLKWLDQWNPSFESVTSEMEKDAVKELLNNYSNLKLKGMAVYINGSPAGFTIGEKLREDMIVIHAEKANSSINGLYPFIIKTFLESYYKDIIYVNREEDLGITGLINSKLSYHPLWLEPVYSITLNT